MITITIYLPGSPLSNFLIASINQEFGNFFRAKYDKSNQDILITDSHNNQLRLMVNNKAKLPKNRLVYLTFGNDIVNTTVEVEDNEQLNDYLALINSIHTTIANWKGQ